MKKLQMIRHAKSSWQDSSLRDIDRPLNKRGEYDSERMGPIFICYGCDFSHTYASPALRARSTIMNISASIDQSINWESAPELYTFDSADLLDWIKELDNSIACVTLVGHNPAITDVYNSLSSNQVDNIPTCALAKLELEINSWRDIDHCRKSAGIIVKPKDYLY